MFDATISWSCSDATYNIVAINCTVKEKDKIPIYISARLAQSVYLV